MKISIFGLGYVGCVSAACLASDGHYVVGVDVNVEKVKSIQAGCSPIVEPGLLDLIKNCVATGHLTATVDVFDAIQKTDLSIICVGTPSQFNGALDLSYVARVSEQIGTVIKQKQTYHSIVIRSTVLPGTTEDMVIPILEKSSEKKAQVGFGVAFNPEFLREGTAIYDFAHPSRTVIGELDEITGNLLVDLYDNLDAPLVRVPIRVSEAVKYADNSFHALKVAFANELGAFCKVNGIDSHDVMEIFALDTKLNLSPYYLKPGPAFGGSCLPKDVRALLYALRKKDIEAPVLEAILPSNEVQKKRALQLVIQAGKMKVGILGLSFKENTDDLRESPAVNLAENLIGKGYDVCIYDPELQMGNLIGANRAFIQNYLPHLDKLLAPSLEEVVAESETIVISTPNRAFETVQLLLRPGQKIIDLVRLFTRSQTTVEDQYYGIAW